MLIGDGQLTKVFQDSWIGQKPAARAQVIRWNCETQHPHPPYNLRVSELLLNEGREWNRDLVARYFPEEEVRKIMQTRTCGKGSKDLYTWDYTKTGSYTVKSSYWVSTNIRDNQALTVVDQPSLDHLYHLAWNTDTSPKVHHFLWRCINNIIPVAGNMARKHISKEVGCYRCGHENETTNHVLFRCPLARLVWALSPIPAPPDGMMMQSLYSNIHHVLSVQKRYPNDDVHADIVPWLMCRLWKNQNELIFNDKEREEEELIKRASEDAEEWRGRKQVEALGVERSGVQRTTTADQSHQWQPPSQDWLKCNSDGVWRQDIDSSG